MSQPEAPERPASVHFLQPVTPRFLGGQKYLTTVSTPAGAPADRLLRSAYADRSASQDAPPNNQKIVLRDADGGWSECFNTHTTWRGEAFRDYDVMTLLSSAYRPMMIAKNLLPGTLTRDDSKDSK